MNVIIRQKRILCEEGGICENVIKSFLRKKDGIELHRQHLVHMSSPIDLL